MSISCEKMEYELSIVVPCYNCVKTLRRTVNSLLDQYDINEEKDYQIVLVDDGSTDKTGEICDEYEKNCYRIKVIHKANGGLVDAWKKGVVESDGKYIAFCDSDDYIDCDFVRRVSLEINSNSPELIVFGMKTEYDNGQEEYHDVLLDEGFYDESMISSKIRPYFLSNGEMQSEMFLASRCNKVFKNDLIRSIMKDVPEDVSFGEDSITTFAVLLNCKSISVIKNYYPYHYVRNNDSMIGAYDEHVFERIGRLCRELSRIAEENKYEFPDQICREKISLFLLYIKKELCKSPHNYKTIKANLQQVLVNEELCSAKVKDMVCDYKGLSKIFAYMILNELFLPSYILARVFEAIRGRRV